MIWAQSIDEVMDLASEFKIKTLRISGGAKVYDSFFNIADEIILSIEQITLGEGIPFLSKHKLNDRFEIKNSKKLKNGIKRVEYKVI